MQDKKPSIIIDFGLSSIKAGLNDFSYPITIPSVIGLDSSYYGQEALDEVPLIQTKYLTNNEKDFQYIESILDYIIQKYNFAPEESNILFTKSPIPEYNKQITEFLTELIFETFCSPGIYFASTTMLSIYSSGKITGTICEIGDSASYVESYNQGYLIGPSRMSLPIAGRKITETLFSSLGKNDHHLYTLDLNNARQYNIIKKLKESHCYVAHIIGKEKTTKKEISCNLPDGYAIKIMEEAFMAPEILFDHELFDYYDTKRIPEIVLNSIEADKTCKKDLLESIVLSGGTTRLRGIDKRLELELISKLAFQPEYRKYVHVIRDPDCISPWNGGKLLANISTMGSMWVTQEEYNENGVGIIHQKCK